MIATGAPLPVRVRVRQGDDAVKRPSILGLHVDAEKRVFVSGHGVEIAPASPDSSACRTTRPSPSRRAAVTVVDDSHRKGLGRLLATKLAEAAREPGIHT
jgi:hypothetical protein